MKKELNLCIMLKGHEGETFYSPLYGNVELVRLNYSPSLPIYLKVGNSGSSFTLTKGGHYASNECGEILLFPSKDQRDWAKWDKENNPKLPKTWSEYCKIIPPPTSNDYKDYPFAVNNHVFVRKNITPIEKSALALLKIHQLIEAGYGGNVTKEEWLNGDDVYVIGFDGTEFRIFYNPSMIHTLAFHTEEQAEEFLKYEENIQLLKDYFMLK